MENSTSYDYSSDRMTGILISLLFLSLVINELTEIKIKTDINGIHDSLKFIGGHYQIFIANSINQLVSLILYIALAASILIGFKVIHNTLSHFISFGIAATGLTIIVAASGSLSLLNITREYLISTGVESEIIAINGLTIAELRKNALLIAFTLEGISIFLIGLYIAITKTIKTFTSYISIISGILLIILCWLKYSTLSFSIIRIIIITNYLLIAILFLKKGFNKSTN